MGICKKHEIIGVDICGDSSCNNKIFLNSHNDEINNRSNEEILNMIEEEFDYELAHNM